MLHIATVGTSRQLSPTSETSPPLCPSSCSPPPPIHFHFCSQGQNAKKVRPFLDQTANLCGRPWAGVAVQRPQHSQSPVTAARGPLRESLSHALRCLVAVPALLPSSLTEIPSAGSCHILHGMCPPKSSPKSLSWTLHHPTTLRPGAESR